MVKKFHVPPPVGHARRDAKVVGINFADLVDVEKVKQFFKQSDPLGAQSLIYDRFMRYATTKVEAASSAVLPEAKSIVIGACSSMAFFYAGKRIGNMEVNLKGLSDGRAANDAGVVISNCLEFVGETLGQKQTTQMFRRLEQITNDVLRQQFGHSR